MGLLADVPSLTVAKTTEASLKLAESAASAAAGAAASAVTAYGTRTWEKASGMRFDPAPAYLFYVELSGLIVALFTNCSGLDISRDVEKVEEGGVNNYVHKLPGRVSYKNITLSRGLTVSRTLWDWMKEGRYDSRVRRINFSIIQGAPGHNALTMGANLISGGSSADSFQSFLAAMGAGFGKVKHWDVEDAYPVNWSLSELDASSGSAAIETLEIAHHGLSLSWEVMTPMSLTAGPSGLISF